MDALTAIANRQGILCYRPDALSRADLEAVLSAAIAAPSPANLQPWAFVVVTDPERTRQVADYLVQVQEQRVFRDLLGMDEGYTSRLMGLYESFHQAPCFVLVCLERKVDFARQEDEPVLRQWELVSLGAALQNLMVAATALGLGTRWFGGFSLDDSGWLQRFLGVPAGIPVIAATPLGYHDEPPKERPRQDLTDIAGFKRGNSRALGRLLRGKLPLEQVVHYQGW